MRVNYHTHTYRCGHAKGTEEEYVKAAIEGGLEVLVSLQTPVFPCFPSFVFHVRSAAFRSFIGFLPTRQPLAV